MRTRARSSRKSRVLRLPMAVKDAIKRINWSYGRGNIAGFRVDPDGKKVVVRSFQFSGNRGPLSYDRRKFSYDGKTLVFLGHKKKV